MSQQLINHSPDLKRLRDEGYEIEVRGGYLLIHHIPFVDQNRQIKYGVLEALTVGITEHFYGKSEAILINFLEVLVYDADERVQLI